ncbi:MAG: pyrroline-5-carboxylate reductase [Sphingosinicella sp.]|nr:pyrroline-5-carboxylate reductase [Sphingosinicella sp.]
MNAPPLPGPFWLVGCGNMAGAMLSRWLASGIDPTQITVIRPSGKPAGEGVRVLTTYPEGEVPALVMLGIKPQKIGEVAPLLAPILDPGTILISILAGIESASLRTYFPAPADIIKAMPNLPVKLGKGVINLFADHADTEARWTVEQLMTTLGTSLWFDDERTFQAAGILSGAGPAFLFRFIDALAAAGEKIGLPREQASQLALAMVEGAGAFAASEPDTPATLADRVASPGGTTRAGLNILDQDEALQQLVRETIEAGFQRSLEMAEEARNSAH